MRTQTPTAAEGIADRSARKRGWLAGFYGSAIGKKWVMAVTGIILLLYIVAHLVGNLKVYLGADELNHYGEFLRELLVPILPRTVTLWIMRIGLLGATVLHIHAAYSLTMMNRRARPDGYAGGREYVVASYASRTMRWTGVIIALFVLFHLADLTWGVEVVNPDFSRGLVYENMLASFERPPVAAIYIVANLALGLHLYHGLWSMFQSLGWNNPRFNHWRRWFAVGLATAITVGNVSFPIAIVAGLVD